MNIDGVRFQLDQQADQGVNHHTNLGTAPLIKQKELKQNKTSQTVDSEGLVLEAMKRALDRNRQSWGYVKSILKAWVKKGISVGGGCSWRWCRLEE